MTRRNDLHHNHNPQVHAGLWFDKYIQDSTKSAMRSKDDSERAALIRELSFPKKNAHQRIPKQYKEFYQNWQKILLDFGAQTSEAKTTGKNRIAIGLGAESILETNLTLHRTWGVPSIPGSALKGLAASFAHQRLGDGWQEGEANYLELFGDTTQNGAVIFFDALPKFENDTQKDTLEILEDIITPHHSAYYNGKEPLPPADWDSPIPVSFASVRGTFLIAIAPSSKHIKNPKQVVELAYGILKKALMEYGIGAKTSSGYGRLSLGEVSAWQIPDLEPIEDDKPAEPKSEPIPSENPDNQKAKELLESVKVSPLKNKFEQNPGDYIPKFLELSPDVQVQLEVANGFWELLSEKERLKQMQKAAEKRREGKTHWFDGLRKLIGSST